MVLHYPFPCSNVVDFFYNNDNLYEISGTEMQTLVENVLKACKEEVVNETNIYTIIKGKLEIFLIAGLVLFLANCPN